MVGNELSRCYSSDRSSGPARNRGPRSWTYTSLVDDCVAHSSLFFALARQWCRPANATDSKDRTVGRALLEVANGVSSRRD